MKLSRTSRGIAFGLLGMAWLPTVASATFHFMHIEQVTGGVNGNTTAQAIQIRMRSNGQDQIERAKLIAWDANGEGPITLIDMQENVAVATAGARVLIVSENFIQFSDPPVVADFILERTIPESYLAAGSITFENDEGTLVVCRLSWGGASYTGDTTGAQTNDDDGDFGPPVPAALTSLGIQSFLYTPDFAGLSTTNADDYVIQQDPVVFTNNAGMEFTLTGGLCVDDVNGDDDFDGVCGGEDNCPSMSNADQSDADGDGVGDACDGCRDDASKVEAGDCGCGHADEDADGNGVSDCLEQEPPDDGGGPDEADDDEADDDGVDGTDDDGVDGTDDDSIDDNGNDNGSDGEADGVDGEDDSVVTPTISGVSICGQGMPMASVGLVLILVSARVQSSSRRG